LERVEDELAAVTPPRSADLPKVIGELRLEVGAGCAELRAVAMSSAILN
jgi:hypothetical protein